MTWREWMGIAIARRTDAAGVDDQASVAKPDRARNVGVGAKDKFLRDTFGGLLDRIQRGHAHGAVGEHGLQPIDLVMIGRGVTEKDPIAIDARRRHRPQPIEMFLLELRMRWP